MIPQNILEELYRQFTEFIESVSGEQFSSFKTSNYVDEQENYKYSIYREAKRQSGSKDWKLEDIGTGKIQKAVNSAILKKVVHNGKNEDNNLIYWMQKDDFSKLKTDKNLEQLFFDFYKNKIPPQRAFHEFAQYFDYQLIAYLFFINNKEQFLPISQKVFDNVISDKLHISDFKTSGNISWENYKTFNEIIKEVYRFLRTKDKNSELLDAHSFLWILGKQREAWLSEQNSAQPNSQTKAINKQKDFNTELEQFSPSSINEYDNQNEPKNDIEEVASEHRKNVFTPADIIWVKNVTNYSTGQAYMDLEGDQLDSFVLHFPDQVGDNVKSPQVGEIILLRQYVNGISAFTHLVSPIESEPVEEDNRPGFSTGRRVQVVAITPINDLIPASSVNWKDIFTRGNAVKIESIYKSGLIDNLQLSIWERFKPYFVNDRIESLKVTSELLTEIESSDDNLTFAEGKLRLVAHYARERNTQIIKLKKQRAIENNTLHCEVCGFSFLKKYNVEFIECHHRTPISETGETETRLEDLALVCANCHRMLHKKINGHFLSIQDLRSICEQTNI